MARVDGGLEGSAGPTDEATQHAQDRKSFFGCLLVVAALAVVGVAIAAVVMSLRAGGDTVARIALTESPAEQAFSLAAASTVEVWTDLELTHRGISYMVANEDLPHVIDYQIDIRRDGRLLHSMTCNPFESNFARQSYYGASSGTDGRSYDGRIRDCAFQLPAGTYSVVARRETFRPDARFRFERTVLILRTP